MSESLLHISHIKVQNANALSSPFTIGFPAMTAWLGAAHALQRKIQHRDVYVNFEAVAVVSHDFELQTYKGLGDFVSSIIGTANPVEKDGKRPAFIEEARCHCDVSLVLQCKDIRKKDEEKVIEHVFHCLTANMKIAGGDILSFKTPQFYREFSELKAKLMPGYAIIERRDLMTEAMEQGADGIDALLEYLLVNHECKKEMLDDKTIVQWSSRRKPTGPGGEKGWIVPIATGFYGISELATAKNQRDPEAPHRFAESVVTLGEFIMPYKVSSVDELLWQYQFEKDKQLYLCQQTGKQQLTEESDF